MKPYFEESGMTIYHGDCREVMPRLADCSVDSVVTDPPYELGFMGKGWDRSGIAYDVSVWRECLRVLKPGGHLLAFGGSRTYHRLACAIEDAGFEIRDQIQWIYGSGFPKSLDVSKAIDQAGGMSPVDQSALLRAKRETAGLSREDVAYAVGCTESSVRDWEEGRSRSVGAPLEYITPSPDYRRALANLLGYSEDERKIVGLGQGSRSLYETGHKGIAYGGATTDAAKQWSGWGTALKPAHEPIVVARKPLIGTVAQNILQHGTGAMNIDGCRINPGEIVPGGGNGSGNYKYGDSGNYSSDREIVEPHSLGRWPANVIHDGSEEVLARFPETTSGTYDGKRNSDKFRNTYAPFSGTRAEQGREGSEGSAARFFYCAKASQEDRDEGLENFIPRQHDDSRKEGNPGGDNPRNRGLAPRANHHPTVKPTDLMRYLVRLVTPPGGTVLDPFCGSGSTGKACALEQMNAILIDSELEYCDLAAARARLTQGLLTFG